MQIYDLTEDFGAVFEAEENDQLFDIGPQQVVEMCKGKGVVYFKGFQPDLAEFERFTDQHCNDWVSYQGGAYAKRILNPGTGNDIFSVNRYTDDDKQITYGLDFHSDMSYMKGRPTFLWFYMVQPAERGGLSGLCDGGRVLRELSESTRKLFETRRIKYIRRYPEGNWQIRFQTDDLAEVRRFCEQNDLQLRIEQDNRTLVSEFCVSAIRHSCWGNRAVFSNSILPVFDQEAAGCEDSLVRFDNGERIPEDIIDEIKQVTRNVCKLIPMQKHEIMWLDNTRMLHGRTPYDDPRRDLAVRHGHDFVC